MQTTMRYGTAESQRGDSRLGRPRDMRAFLKRFALRGRDPAVADENLYRYCADDPTDVIDPTGLDDSPTGTNLATLAAQDPQLKTLTIQQRENLVAQMLDTNSQAYKFAAMSVDTLPAPINENGSYKKHWWLIGPGDQQYPGNVPAGNYKVTYNCLGQVLEFYGEKQFNGKDIVSNGTSTWPANQTSAVADLDKTLATDWDPLFNKLGQKLGHKGFKRMAWKPDFSTLKKASASPLPAFARDRNYIILMAQFSVKPPYNENKPVDQLYFQHVFTNFNQAHSWWISKVGNGGTMLMDSPTALAGQQHYEGVGYMGFGYIVGIWEEQK